MYIFYGIILIKLFFTSYYMFYVLLSGNPNPSSCSPEQLIYYSGVCASDCRCKVRGRLAPLPFACQDLSFVM